jgi:hypothetical protein
VILRNRAHIRELPIVVPTSAGRIFLELNDLPEDDVPEDE